MKSTPPSALPAALAVIFFPLAPVSAAGLKTLDDFQAAAAKAKISLQIPDWQKKPADIANEAKEAIEKANAALDQIGRQNLEKVRFETTVGALENLRAEIGVIGNRASLISQTNPNAGVRRLANEAMQSYQEWIVSLDYREDVYQAIRAFAATSPKLTGEDAKLLAETLRDYRRAGMELPPDKRKEVQGWRKQLSELGNEFETNLFASKGSVIFSKEELDGVPADLLATPGMKTVDNRYQILAGSMSQYNTVEDNARNETTRRKLYVARDSIAKELNVSVVNKTLELRNKIALALNYKLWADYQAEARMARTADNARGYIEKLVTGLQPRFTAELREIQKLKAADTKDPAAKIYVWDWRYYTNRLTKEKFNVDQEALRRFFPCDQTVAGMFGIFGRVFGIQFTEIKLPFVLLDELRFFVITDQASSAPLGVLNLDLFLREGKTAGGGEFEVMSGRRLADGSYQAPVAGVILGFQPPTADKPSLLSHSEAEVLFHELGHALHCILTQAKYNRFAGTNVPVDFVEAPSQMLQNWIWDKKVLDTFAADYRDPSKKIPAGIIDQMKKAKLATAGMFYRRQCAFALMDLALHGPHPADQSYDCLATSNPVLEQIFLPIDQRTSFITGFRGFNGYDAGYYGYAWADAIAADMATVFEKAKEGYLDRDAGLKLRREVYEKGNTRDVNESVEKFLGRKQSIEPFLEKLGIPKH